MIRVAFDAGHPTREGDKGCAVGSGWEADYTMSWCRNMVSKTALFFGQPVEPLLIRQRDGEVLSLGARAERAKKLNCDLAIVVHVNSATSNLRGARAFYMPGDSLGQSLCDVWSRAQPEPLRYNKGGIGAYADEQWLQRVRNCLKQYHCTTILLELFFASSTIDLELGMDPAYITAQQAATINLVSHFRIAKRRASYGI